MMPIAYMALLLKKSPLKIKPWWNASSWTLLRKSKIMELWCNKPKRRILSSRKRLLKVYSTRRSSKTRSGSKMNSHAKPWLSMMMSLMNLHRTYFWVRGFIVGFYLKGEREECCRTNLSSHQRVKSTTQRILLIF